jgi:hypothetical protein
MPNGNIILVICLTVLIGLGVPAMLYAGMRRKGDIGQIDLLRKAAKRSQSPWQPEDSQLKELGERVDKLRKSSDR